MTMMSPLVFNLLQVKHALAIEVDTGMHHSRGSILKLAKQRFGVVSSTKKGALAEVEAMWAGVEYVRETEKYVAEGGEYKPVPIYKDQRERNAFVRGVELVSTSPRTMEVITR